MLSTRNTMLSSGRDSSNSDGRPTATPTRVGVA